MRIEDLRIERVGGKVRRTVRLSWIGGETDMSIEAPKEHAAPDEDLSAFVPVAMMSAMRRAEPLQVDGAVSERMLGNLPLAQEMISAWNPTLRRTPVRAAAAVDVPGAPSGGRACCISRGVDSMYSVAVEREEGDEITCLVHWRDFELNHSEPTRRRHVKLVEEVARRVGVPLVTVDSDIPRAIIDVVDFDDATSAMLVAAGLSLPGLAGRFLIPSAFSFGEMMPVGTHPMLDPLWSTAAVEVEHDSIVPSRSDKVAWLVQNRPDLLELLYVCIEGDSAENCGRCGKCLWAMLLLHVHGGLERAAFPSRIDPKLLRAAPRPAVNHMTGLDTIYRKLGDSREDAALKRAMRGVLRDATKKPLPPDLLSMTALRARRLQMLMHGHLTDVPAVPAGTASAEIAPLDPDWPPPREQPAGRLGLVRAVDHAARRHRYAAGRTPPGQRTGELGALLVEEPPDGVPLRLDAEGRALMDDLSPARSPAATARWVVGPLVWRGGVSPVARVRSVGRRLLDVRRGRETSGSGEIVGWLHDAGGDGRVELFAAAHPVLDDVLLTTDLDEAGELGYGEPVSLGFLERGAPVTGELGTTAATIPWARNWGHARKRAG